jgi:oligopeptidase A
VKTFAWLDLWEKCFDSREQEQISFSKKLNIEKMEAWDVAYLSEKLRQAKYSFSENEVKQYFPEHRVLKGLFKVVETIFKLKIIKTETPTWHKDVSFYSIKNEDKFSLEKRVEEAIYIFRLKN